MAVLSSGEGPWTCPMKDGHPGEAASPGVWGDGGRGVERPRLKYHLVLQSDLT